tara:strand:+ start:28 stop:447 length:420 start_codon:yes stop_codon:yes gene_type:complete
MIATFRHLGIVVNDLEKFENFFNCLGFTTIYSETEKGKDIEALLGCKNTIQIIKMKNKSENVIELLKYLNVENTDSGSKLPWSNGVNHIALNVRGLEDYIDKFCEFGGQLIGEVVEKPDVKLCYIQDFEHNIFELVEEK